VKYYTNKARQAGMTLIELTVVLLVLIGLAGLMIPYVGGFVSKTHDSANSDSLAEVNKAIQRYDVQFMGQPEGFDSLITSTVAAASATNANIYTKMMGGKDPTKNVYLKEVAIDGGSFADLGITSLKAMDDTTSDATFQATSGDIALASGTMQSFAALNVKGSNCVMGTDAMGCISNDADLSKILGRTVDTTTSDYVVFGVGQESTMVGKTMSEAPVHFAKTGAMSAANKYNRILAVYSVSKGFCAGFYTDSTATTTADAVQPTTMMTCNSTAGNAGGGMWTGAGKAKFETTVMPMMMLEGLGGALASHYSSVDS